VVIPDNISGSCYLVELVGCKPVVLEDYDKFKMQARTMLVWPARQQFLRWWFDPQQIRLRMSFKTPTEAGTQ